MIENEGGKTIIECRAHSKPQDVKWIEELIGRRVSLGAEEVIAVSSSGFTEGAKKKAKKHLIALRDLSDVYDSDVLSWGKRARMFLEYLIFEEIEIKLEIVPVHTKTVSVEKVHDEFKEKAFLFFLLQSLRDYIAKKNVSLPKTISSEWGVENPEWKCGRLNKVNIRTTVRKTKSEKGISLAKPVKKVIVNSKKDISKFEKDIKETGKILK